MQIVEMFVGGILEPPLIYDFAVFGLNLKNCQKYEGQPKAKLEVIACRSKVVIHSKVLDDDLEPSQSI